MIKTSQNSTKNRCVSPCVHFSHVIRTGSNSGSDKHYLGKVSQANIIHPHVRDYSQRESIFHLQRSWTSTSSLLQRYNLPIKDDLPAAQNISCYSVPSTDTTCINIVQLEKKNPA